MSLIVWGLSWLFLETVNDLRKKTLFLDLWICFCVRLSFCLPPLSVKFWAQLRGIQRADKGWSKSGVCQAPVPISSGNCRSSTGGSQGQRGQQQDGCCGCEEANAGASEATACSERARIHHGAHEDATLPVRRGTQVERSSTVCGDTCSDHTWGGERDRTGSSRWSAWKRGPKGSDGRESRTPPVACEEEPSTKGQSRVRRGAGVCGEACRGEQGGHLWA